MVHGSSRKMPQIRVSSIVLFLTRLPFAVTARAPLAARVLIAPIVVIAATVGGLDMLTSAERLLPREDRAATDSEPLEAGFRNPPREFSQVPFWSWNGRLEPDRLRWQIDQMVEKGVYGAFLHARVGLNLDSTPYFSDGWWKAIEAAVEHGSKVGFSTWLYDEDQWPSGAAGGRTIRASPERNTRKGLKRVEQRHEGPRKVPLRIPQALYVVAGKLEGTGRLDPGSLVNITAHNDATLAAVDVTPTRGLRVAVISDWKAPMLAPRCRELGCAVTELRTQQAATVQLEGLDVLISDVGTPGTTLSRDTLLEWIRAGGGYIDFSHSEPTDPLYDLEVKAEEDAADHRWRLPEHSIASVPNPDPDADYAGRRWSDMLWRGGRDFDGFDQVLIDPRSEPPGASILARDEGKGRVVLCGATQACREEGGHVELLQNLLVYAARRQATVVRGTVKAHRSESKAAWDCPEGSWLVIAYLADTNPGTEAMPAVNYLNRATVRDFIDITYEEYARRVGAHFGKTVPGVFFDEIHNSLVEIVWVEGFAEEFRRLKGYDLIPNLPALSYDIGPKTPKVRCDYYDVYTRIYEESWFAQIAGWCTAHGLLWTGHTVEDLDAYRTQGSYFRTIRHLQIPGTDNEDFRYRYPRRIGPWKPKQLASISHLYGRPRAMAEAMGGAGWQFTLESARYGFSLLAAYGINFFIPHLFHYAQDRPENVDDWPNSWFFQNPYWKYYKTLADYGRRLSYLLTGGEHVAQVAVLFPIENLWAGYGEGSAQRTVQLLVAAQIDVDVIDPESLVAADVKDGRLRTFERIKVWPGRPVPGPTYEVLVLPGIRCIGREAARKIRELIEAGGRLVVHDRWPTDSSEGGRDDPELGKLRELGAAHGIGPSPVATTVQRIRELIDPDLIAAGDLREPLRYHHMRREGREVYFLANDSAERRSGRVSLRASGALEVWDPEDGSVRAVGAYVHHGGRTECEVTLDGGQGLFYVVDTRREPQRQGVEIRSSSLERLEVMRVGVDSLELRGLLPPGAARAEVGVVIREGETTRSLSASSDAPPAPSRMPLTGPWSFLPAGDTLDQAWKIDVGEVEIGLPVLSVRWEHEVNGRTEGWMRPEFDHSGWRRVKVFDALHPTEGAHRYRSRWEARFISHYDYSGFHTRTGGRGLRCRRTLELPGGDAGGSGSAGSPGGPSGAAGSNGSNSWGGWLAVVTEGPFRLIVNDRTFEGRGGAKPEDARPVKFEVAGLRPGENQIGVETEAARAILVEGHLRSSAGAQARPRLTIATDRTWEVSLDGKEWRPAWEYVAPPAKPYGEPEYPEPRPVPSVVWYRQLLPPGVVAVLEPKVDGRWRLWIDGQPQLFLNGEAMVEPQDAAAAQGAGRELVLRVRTEEESQRGLLEPIRIRLRPAPQPLGSWTRWGLDWYSGRAIYETTFQLGPEHRSEGVRIELDLGRVAYSAEVWLNGKLAGTRVWPPYRLDVTDCVVTGANRLTVVVANLLANRMSWDIFDDVVGVEWNRKWHDGNIRRDAWCLESGLVGPVEIVPYREVRLEAR